MKHQSRWPVSRSDGFPAVIFRRRPKPSLLGLRFNALTLQPFNVGKARRAFTLIELIVVVGIIAILAALVLSTVGYARKKGQRARAETEIAAMSAACENYKADNGVYPCSARHRYARLMTEQTILNATDNLNADTWNPTDTTDPTYGATSLYLYTLLSGDTMRQPRPNRQELLWRLSRTCCFPPAAKAACDCNSRSVWQQLRLFDCNKLPIQTRQRAIIRHSISGALLDLHRLPARHRILDTMQLRQIAGSKTGRSL